MTFNGVMVYRVDVVHGFDLLGGVDHRDPHATTTWSHQCYNWWQNPNSQVKRSIFMEDYVYSISLATMKINNVTSLGVDLASFVLPAGAASEYDAGQCWEDPGGW
jgi:hypothetical protein